MARSCEVCAHLAGNDAGTKNPGRLRRVAVDGRIVALCETHAALVTGTDANSVVVLRNLFHEASGKRSLIDRRSPLDRRLFPPRPEGRRMASGRRGEDGKA